MARPSRSDQIVHDGLYVVFPMVEIAIPLDLFAGIQRRIDRLRAVPVRSAAHFQHRGRGLSINQVDFDGLESVAGIARCYRASAIRTNTGLVRYLRDGMGTISARRASLRASILAPNRSAAARSGSSARWAYRLVVSGFV